MYKKSVVFKTIAGAEEMLADELRELGVEDVELGRRAAGGSVDQSVLYSVTYQSSLSLRVLELIGKFPLRKSDDLYQKCVKWDWSEYLNVKLTFAIDAQVNSRHFNHSHFAALRLKDAIADYFRENHGERPDVNAENPDVLFHLHIDDYYISVYRDAGGRSLNQRGYRKSSLGAPLNEVLASALVRKSGWKGNEILVDGMCGSGTLIIEAARLASRTPAQVARPELGFMGWPDYNPSLWTEVKAKADAARITPPCDLFASDIHGQAVKAARANAERAGMEAYIHWDKGDFFEASAPADHGVLLMNPPYGERLSLEDATAFYKKLGDAFKNNWKGWNCFVLGQKTEAFKQVGLKPKTKSNWLNGTLECGFNQYEIFSGSHKDFKREKNQ